MALRVPNIDRLQKQNAPLGEALQTIQTYTNLTTTLKGNYIATITYSKGDVVLSAGIYYRSLMDTNLGNTPATTPSTWVTIGTAQMTAPTFVNPSQGFR